MDSSSQISTCQACSASGAHRYQLIHFNEFGRSSDEQVSRLCVKCARTERERLKGSSHAVDGLTRAEFISELDSFFEAAGVFEICRRCHEQGTGCCPPTCRVMGARGCDPINKFGKTVFCASFVCGALLNAISECDPEIGRRLSWIKRELGPAEFRVYQMITRVPATAREAARPLTLPERYPYPIGQDQGIQIREKLLAMANEVLEIRRIWKKVECSES